MLCDCDLVAANPADQRRVEILADGLPLFGEAQLEVDTTLVSPLHCDCSPHLRATMQAARLRKERIPQAGWSTDARSVWVATVNHVQLVCQVVENAVVRTALRSPIQEHVSHTGK